MTIFRKSICILVIFASMLSNIGAEEHRVDVLVAGGSLSSLAAAITLANLSSTHRIAYLEPTSWVGGQLTSSSVPPDFGPYNNVSKNLPQSFVDILLAVGSVNEEWNSNQGNAGFRRNVSNLMSLQNTFLSF